MIRPRILSPVELRDIARRDQATQPPISAAEVDRRVLVGHVVAMALSRGDPIDDLAREVFHLTHGGA